jgi:hypothetical protein
VRLTIKVVGLPLLSEVIGRELEFESRGHSIRGLVESLHRHYGEAFDYALLDSRGKIECSVQILLNEERTVRPEQYEHDLLNEGDTVTFMMLIPGG